VWSRLIIELMVALAEVEEDEFASARPMGFPLMTCFKALPERNAASTHDAARRW